MLSLWHCSVLDMFLYMSKKCLNDCQKSCNGLASDPASVALSLV